MHTLPTEGDSFFPLIGTSMDFYFSGLSFVCLLTFVFDAESDQVCSVLRSIFCPHIHRFH